MTRGSRDDDDDERQKQKLLIDLDRDPNLCFLPPWSIWAKGARARAGIWRYVRGRKRAIGWDRVRCSNDSARR